MDLLLLTAHRSLFTVSRLFLFVLYLLLPSNLCASPTGREFQIGEYRALSLFGDARILPDVAYVSFAGDFGFSGRLPPKDVIDRHVAQESALLANFQLRVINLEYMLPGISGREPDRQIDKVAVDILRRSGFDVISRANNHAMDHGVEGVAYNSRILQEARFMMIGPRGYPVHIWDAAGGKIAIFSLTDYTDRPDADGLILKINDADLSLIKTKFADANFRIAFIHLGSLSFYPSAHERDQVKRILDAGADLVVGTGSHFIKGFLHENQKPVIYGIGNHIFSYVDNDTEPIGLHFVAGFKSRQLIQLFVVPFYNTIREGKTGPLDEASFVSFKKSFADRSINDSSRYYSDPRTVAGFQERLRELTLSKFRDLRARHFIYATGILIHNYPWLVTSACLSVLVGATIVGRWTVLRWRRRRT